MDLNASITTYFILHSSDEINFPFHSITCLISRMWVQLPSVISAINFPSPYWLLNLNKKEQFIPTMLSLALLIVGFLTLWQALGSPYSSCPLFNMAGLFFFNEWVGPWCAGIWSRTTCSSLPKGMSSWQTLASHRWSGSTVSAHFLLRVCHSFLLGWRKKEILEYLVCQVRTSKNSFTLSLTLGWNSWNFLVRLKQVSCVKYLYIFNADIFFYL